MTSARNMFDPDAEPPRGPSGQASSQYLSLHEDVFVLYRPLDACPFCRKRLNTHVDGEGNLVEPENALEDPRDTEYLCPHVRKKEHDELLAKAVAGTVDIMSRDRAVVSGTVQVTVAWGTLRAQKNGPPGAPPRRA